MSAVVLAARDLAVVIGGKAVCRGLGFEAQAGECWGLMGLNGSGKTTLLLTLAGLRAPQSGRVDILGRASGEWSGRELARRRGLMPQDTLDAFPLTVLEAALAGRFPHQPGLGWDSREDVAIARAALAEVELDALAARDCATLSGGERRRLALAALLAQRPDLYLLDEPTNHLDPHHQIALLELLAARRRAGATVLMSLHDPNLAARYCSHVLLLFGDGASLWGPAGEMLGAEQLSRLYAHPMRAYDTAGGRVFVPAGGAP